MRRLGIRIANAALFVVCCYAAAGIFNEISGGMLATLDEGPGLEVADAPQQIARSAARIRDINQRNLFGSAVVAEALPEPEPEPELVTTITKLPLTLLGTAAFESDIASSRAAIANRGGKEPEVLAIGDFLESYPDVQVAGISAREVILDNEGSREILRLEDQERGKAGSGRESKSSRSSKRSARSSRRSRSSTAASKTVTGSSGSPSKLVDNLRKLAEQTSRGGGVTDLLSQAQILPKYEDGAMVGIELSGIQPGSLYEEFGLKDGDVISEVNGAEISSPTASQEVLASLTGSNEIIAIVNGEEFVVPAQKIEELVEAGLLDR